MNEPGKSDESVVPEKPPNKSHTAVWKAEAVEGRDSAKGNPDQQRSGGAQDPNVRLSQALDRIRQAAVRSRKEKFTALFHHIADVDRLRKVFHELRNDAAAGVDGVTKSEYGATLETRLADLASRLRRGAYRPPPVRRVHIPKPDGGQRPLGIPTLEDKLVQRAAAEVLGNVYETMFVGFSYGYRPGRGAHDALDAVWVGISRRKVNWLLDADIRGFFDSLDHEWMLRILEQRIGDSRLLQLLRRWLKAGVLEREQWSATQAGTPQGGSISPLLANVYLHYVFDLWVHDWRRHAHGDVIVVRYADDFVVGFQHREEAQRFQAALAERLRRFALELHPEKTRLIQFGRYAALNRQERGEGKPETFDFLGFTHACSRGRRGQFHVRRKTIRKRFTRTLRGIKAGLVARRHVSIPRVGAWLGAVLKGWYGYHAIPHNGAVMTAMHWEVGRAWYRTLRRRSQHDRMTWARMREVIATYLPPVRILHPWPHHRLRVT